MKGGNPTMLIYTLDIYEEFGCFQSEKHSSYYTQLVVDTNCDYYLCGRSPETDAFLEEEKIFFLNNEDGVKITRELAVKWAEQFLSIPEYERVKKSDPKMDMHYDCLADMYEEMRGGGDYSCYDCFW